MRTPRRSSQGKRRYDNPPFGRTVTVGTLVIAVLAFAGYMATRIYNGIPGRQYETVYVSTPQIGNLLPHDAVRIHGVRVGQVLKAGLGDDGRPRLELQLDPHTRLTSDTRVGIRASGLLGARFVELVPGISTSPLAAKATLDGTRDSYTYGLPEALDVFDEHTREGLGSTIDNVGAGLFTNGVRLNRTLVTLATRTQQFDAVARTVLSRQGAAARLLPALDAAVTPLARNRSTTAAFDAAGAKALGPFVRERDATRDTIAKAPATLETAARGLTQGRGLLGAVRTLSGQANRTLPVAPTGLDALTALLRTSHAPLERASTLLDAVKPAVPSALRITQALDPVLPGAGEAIRLLTPIAGAVGEHGCDIITFGTSMRSMTGFTQPGEGPAGPAMAFRLQPVAATSPEGVGLDAGSGQERRDHYAKPCSYPSTSYPTFVPANTAGGR